MDNTQTQQLFFNHIKSKLPLHLSFVDEVAELLDISTDSAYRRIRGEKMIGLDEIQILCNKYQISLDELLHIQSNAVVFTGNRVSYPEFGFDKYLRDLVSNLELFCKLPNPHLSYVSKDIPIFHFMHFPELSAFKFFFWKRTILGYPDLARQQFNGEESDEETARSARRIIELYMQIPSTEIWIEESINITIKQIEFYRSSNIFTNKHILLKVYLQLEELMIHLELQAEVGRKFLHGQAASLNGAPFNIYTNECLIGDNTIFVEAGERQITFINHNGLNFMGTQDKGFCEYTKKNLQNTIKKSTHISVVGEKERSMFFNILRAKIYEQKKNLI
jgi:hypothetical protein